MPCSEDAPRARKTKPEQYRKARTPDQVRTGVTALRGRRPRPLDDGGWTYMTGDIASFAGVPGLEPRLAEPESAGLPITPYPIGGTTRNFSAVRPRVERACAAFRAAPRTRTTVVRPSYP